MAITNPQVVKFSNEEARRIADIIHGLYNAAKSFQLEWDANDMGTIIPNDNAEIVQDGSDVDGRGPVSGSNLHGMKAYIDGFVSDLEANSNAKLTVVARISVNPRA